MKEQSLIYSREFIKQPMPKQPGAFKYSVLRCSDIMIFL